MLPTRAPLFLFLSCTRPCIGAFSLQSCQPAACWVSPWPCWLYPLKAWNQGGRSEQGAAPNSSSCQPHKTVQDAYSGETTREAAVTATGLDLRPIQHKCAMQGHHPRQGTVQHWVISTLPLRLNTSYSSEQRSDARSITFISLAIGADRWLRLSFSLEFLLTTLGQKRNSKGTGYGVGKMIPAFRINPQNIKLPVRGTWVILHSDTGRMVAAHWS